MERRNIIGAAMLSAAIAGGGVAGVVLGSPTTSSAATAASTTATPTGRPPFGPGRRGGLGLDAAAKAIGITTAELQTDLKAGKTIAEVAKAKGVSVDTVIAAMVAAAKTDLESNLQKIITDEVNGTFTRPDGPTGPDGPHRGFGFRGGFGLDTAAKAIGVTSTELQSDLKSGKTIAAVAKAKGVSVQKVIDAMVAGMQTELDAQVKAGHLTADQAAKIKANLTQMITDQVNGTFTRPSFGGMRGPGGFGGPGGGYGGPANGTPSAATTGMPA